MVLDLCGLPQTAEEVPDLPRMFGNPRRWKHLSESGPAHLHAYIFPFGPLGEYPASVLKMYPVDKIEDAVQEAKYLCIGRHARVTSDVYGVYKTDTHVYIHMRKLKETLMARIEREGLAYVFANKHRFNDMWNRLPFNDLGSMCRVDNMMFDEHDELLFIDTEKVEMGNPMGLMKTKEVFVNSALQAAGVHAFNVANIDMIAMGEVYLKSNGRFSKTIRQRHFTVEAANNMVVWFEKYEKEYLSIHEWLTLRHRDLRAAFEMEPTTLWEMLYVRTPYKHVAPDHMGVMKETYAEVAMEIAAQNPPQR